MSKLIIVTTLLLSVVHGYSKDSDPCENKFSKFDMRVYGKKITDKNSCKLVWEVKGKQQALQVIVRKKKCTRYVEGDLVDCVVTRYCPASVKEEANFASPLYYEGDKNANGICTKGKKEEVYPILGMPEDYVPVPYNASVKCENGQPVGILLKSGTGKEKLCKIPRFSK